MPYFKLTDFIHEGAYGRVYKAEMVSKSQGTRMDVAIKRLSRPLHHTLCAQHVYHEIEMLTQLQQSANPRTPGASNIVRYITHFEENAHLHIVMEYAPDNLANYLTYATDSAMMLTYLNDMLAGVMFCHQQQVLHRDLKPDNLLVTPTCLRLADFGLAKRLYLDVNTHERTQNDSYDTRRRSYVAVTPGGTQHERKNSRQELLTSGMVTLYYRAPELLTGGKHAHYNASDYSYSTDMWSVGCISAEMLFALPDHQYIVNNIRQVLDLPRLSSYPPQCYETILFRGSGETPVLDQMRRIVHILGSPNESTWPSFNQHRWQPEPFAAKKKCPNRLCVLEPHLATVDGDKTPPTYISFLKVCLATLKYEPSQRHTAAQLYNGRYIQ